MAWVEQVGIRSWRVRFPNDDGGVTSIGGFPSRESAREYGTTLEIQQRQGQWIDPVAGRLPVAEWVGQWWPTVDVAERTEDNYRSNLRNHVLPRWGDRRLCDITTSEVHAWTRDLRAAGYAPSTVTSQIKLLSMILADAVDARLITLDPVRRRRRGRRVVSPLRRAGLGRPRSRRSHRRTSSPARWLHVRTADRHRCLDRCPVG